MKFAPVPRVTKICNAEASATRASPLTTLAFGVRTLLQLCDVHASQAIQREAVHGYMYMGARVYWVVSKGWAA